MPRSKLLWCASTLSDNIKKHNGIWICCFLKTALKSCSSHPYEQSLKKSSSSTMVRHSSARAYPSCPWVRCGGTPWTLRQFMKTRRLGRKKKRDSIQRSVRTNKNVIRTIEINYKMEGEKYVFDTFVQVGKCSSRVLKWHPQWQALLMTYPICEETGGQI